MSALNILQQKYANAFYFYTTKSINELIYVIGNTQSIQFEDIKFSNDDEEYLKRSYRVKTLDGRSEIDDRIKVIASKQYYQENHMLTYEMPMMFVTSNKDLFLKRQKRFKQLQKIQHSQNIQNHPPSQNNQQKSPASLSIQIIETLSEQQAQSTFLDELSLSFDVLMNENDEEYIDINDQLDSSVHDVFQYQQDIDTSQGFNLGNQSINGQNKIFALDEQKLFHLVYDFEDVDIDQAINFYKEIVKSKNGSTIMSQILEEEQIKFSRKSSEKSIYKKQNILKTSFPLTKPPLPKHPKQSVLQSYISIFGSKLPKSKSKMKLYAKNDIQSDIKTITNKLLAQKYYDEVRNMDLRTIQNEEEEDEQTKKQIQQKSKTRIRQKAQQLLQKIKRQSFSIDFR